MIAYRNYCLRNREGFSGSKLEYVQMELKKASWLATVKQLKIPKELFLHLFVEC